MSLDLPVATRNKELKLTGLSDSELKFNAIALTDSYHKGSKVVFYQSGSKAEEVEKVIQDCGIGYRKVERNRSPEEICGVKLKTTQVAYEFHMERPEWCVTQNKTIPKEFFYLTEDQFEIFLDMLIFCDGSPMDDRASSVFYGKKQICDDVQSLCQMNGFRASITEYRTGQYRVNINPRNKQRFKKVLQDEVKDWVYCITVPEGNFLARQGGVSLFTGNCRIKTAIKHDPRIEGKTHGISFSHLQTDTWFNEYHEYENSAPAIATYGGVDFAHYFSSGNFGSATSGVHHAYSVINNRHRSSVCGHSHKRDVYFKDAPGSLGMVVGCFKGKEESWAGQANLDWWKGIVVMHDVGEGRFEPQFVSMKMLKEEYGE